MKQRYLAALLLLGLGAGCTPDKYVLDVYATMRYDVLKLPAPADTARLLAVAFPTASVGFVGGGKGLLYTTTNGGQTWTSRTQAGIGDVNTLYFSTATAGWAATSNGLYRTANGGQTWQAAQYISVNGYRAPVGATADVQFVTPLIGYAAGTTGDIAKTTDGGVNWLDQLPRGHQRFVLRGVSFTSPDSGQVVGETRYVTANGGRTWADYGSSNFFDYDVLLYGPGRYLEAELHTPHFTDNPPIGSGGATRFVNDDLNRPVYAIAHFGKPGGPMAAVGENTVVIHSPDFAATIDADTPWTNVHAPDGTSFRVTFLAAAFADAHTLYAVGEHGTLYRFYYPD